MSNAGCRGVAARCCGVGICRSHISPAGGVTAAGLVHGLTTGAPADAPPADDAAPSPPPHGVQSPTAQAAAAPAATDAAAAAEAPADEAAPPPADEAAAEATAKEAA